MRGKRAAREAPLKARICDALIEGPKNRHELHDEIGSPITAISTALTVMHKRGVVERCRWSRWSLPGWTPPKRRR